MFHLRHVFILSHASLFTLPTTIDASLFLGRIAAHLRRIVHFIRATTYSWSFHRACFWRNPGMAPFLLLSEAGSISGRPDTRSSSVFVFYHWPPSPWRGKPRFVPLSPPKTLLDQSWSTPSESCRLRWGHLSPDVLLETSGRVSSSSLPHLVLLGHVQVQFPLPEPVLAVLPLPMSLVGKLLCCNLGVAVSADYTAHRKLFCRCMRNFFLCEKSLRVPCLSPSERVLLWRGCQIL